MFQIVKYLTHCEGKKGNKLMKNHNLQGSTDECIVFLSISATYKTYVFELATRKTPQEN